MSCKITCICALSYKFGKNRGSCACVLTKWFLSNLSQNECSHETTISSNVLSKFSAPLVMVFQIWIIYPKYNKPTLMNKSTPWLNCSFHIRWRFGWRSLDNSWLKNRNSYIVLSKIRRSEWINVVEFRIVIHSYKYFGRIKQPLNET